jgi:hypothetical protein
MANIPDKFTREAQEERDMRSKLKSAKSRWSWSGECMKFECVNRDIECGQCYKFSEFATND